MQDRLVFVLGFQDRGIFCGARVFLRKRNLRPDVIPRFEYEGIAAAGLLRAASADAKGSVSEPLAEVFPSGEIQYVSAASSLQAANRTTTNAMRLNMNYSRWLTSFS